MYKTRGRPIVDFIDTDSYQIWFDLTGQKRNNQLIVFLWILNEN